MADMALEIYRATVVLTSVVPKTSTKGKPYYQFTDSQGITYSCWDIALAKTLTAGVPIEVAIKRDGRYLNLVHPSEFFKAQAAAGNAGTNLPPAPPAAPAPTPSAPTAAPPPGPPLVQQVRQDAPDRNKEIRRLSLIKSAVEFVTKTPIDGQVASLNDVTEAAAAFEKWVTGDES